MEGSRQRVVNDAPKALTGYRTRVSVVATFNQTHRLTIICYRIQNAQIGCNLFCRQTSMQMWYVTEKVIRHGKHYQKSPTLITVVNSQFKCEMLF